MALKKPQSALDSTDQLLKKLGKNLTEESVWRSREELARTCEGIPPPGTHGYGGALHPRTRKALFPRRPKQTKRRSDVD